MIFSRGMIRKNNQESREKLTNEKSEKECIAIDRTRDTSSLRFPFKRRFGSPLNVASVLL